MKNEIITEARVRYNMDKAMMTFRREIDNTSKRFEAAKSNAIEALRAGNVEKFKKYRSKMDEMHKELERLSDELEQINIEFYMAYGEAM